jgi:hypothetical protein
VREREDAHRTRVAGHLDEIQDVVASSQELKRDGAVRFIEWLGLPESIETSRPRKVTSIFLQLLLDNAANSLSYLLRLTLQRVMKTIVAAREG